MKINRLYIKFFITVMMIVLASHMLLFFLFRAVDDPKKDNFRKDMDSIVFLLKESVSEKIDNLAAKNTGGKNFYEEPFVKNIAENISAHIWIELSDGRTFSSEKNQRPYADGWEQFPRPGNTPPPRGEVLIKIPFETEKTNGTIYASLERGGENSNLFFTGQLIITALVALVLFPMARKITTPLNNLTESANAISRGEFKLKVAETSSDEIGRLASAFNTMSDKVLQMIRGTKELTANISHQVRSPLARINVAADILRDRIESGNTEGAMSALESIENETVEMDKLTGKIIELLRADIAHKKNEYSKIDLKAVADETAVKFSESLSSKNISLNMETQGTDFFTNGIERDISALFDILFDNAAKYTPANGNIILSLKNEKEKNLIEMSNPSEKYSDEELSSVFEPFRRINSNSENGYGLGLAIAKRTVENHGGKISVHFEKERFVVRVII